MRLAHTISKDEGRAIEFIEMTMRPDFVAAIKKLRTKWEINVNEFSDNSEESEKKWLHFLEDSDISKDVKILLSELKILSSWKTVVHQYLIDDNLYPYNSNENQITKDSNGLTLEIDLENTDHIVLRVGPKTTYEDFKIAWSEIVLHRKLKPLRKRVRGNFLRDYQIFILARDGATIREIFSTEAGRGMDFGHIKKIVSAFYDKLKIPKKDRRPLRTGK